MTFEMVDNVLNISTDAVMTVAMAAALLLIGYGVKGKVKFLNTYCIPAPVVGGYLFMFITYLGYVSKSFSFTFNTTFQSPFMLAFFTTVGLGASFSLLKKGGVLLVVYWLVAGIVSIFQNIVGVGVGTLVVLDTPYALLSSAISMIGGHGAAAAYGTNFKEMGYEPAILVGAAAATFGLISGVLSGGPLGRRLIVKYDLKPDPNENFDADVESINAGTAEKLSGPDIMKNVTAILVCMALGTVVSGWIGTLIKMSFPTYDSVAWDSIYDRVSKKFDINFVTMDAVYKTPWIAKKIFVDEKLPILPYTRPKGSKEQYKPWEYLYNPENDTYACPQGGVLRHTTTDGDGKKIYRSTPKYCVNCPHKKRCGANAKGQTVLSRHIWQGYLELAEQLRKPEWAREIYAMRKQTIERVFGDPKEKHAMRYTQHRSLARVTQWVRLKYAAMNLKKLATGAWNSPCFSHIFLVWLPFRQKNQFSQLKYGRSLTD
ncbi:MAG TPA: sodium/glutamate symporter [Clostridia bacterium]|nr:sodium/glutamate symporter [Clostridia bacterium]